jgi:AmmeMemoRadiSam system protein B
MTLRRAAVAGAWYPATAAELTREVQRHLHDADQASDAAAAYGDLAALIAPHAGLVYSGPVAAFAYRLLRAHDFDTIVLVGPSHYVGFDGASVWASGAFETPLGALPIDSALASDILANCTVATENPAAHQREHSLEMQLPFLATLAGTTPIVPIVMGFQTRDTAFALADAIAGCVGDRRALLVASSDLSHFYDAGMAATLDRQVIDRVGALDDEGLMALLERRADHACGGGPMVTVLRASRRSGATRATILEYADSSDVSGDKTSVVGYMAAAVWR